MCDFSSHPAAATAACRERAFKQRKREQTNYSLHIVPKNMSSGPNYISRPFIICAYQGGVPVHIVMIGIMCL